MIRPWGMGTGKKNILSQDLLAGKTSPVELILKKTPDPSLLHPPCLGNGR